MVHAYLSKIPECNEPEKVYDAVETPPFMHMIQANIPVNEDLTIDVSDIQFSNNATSCGSNQIVFVLASSIDSHIYDRRSHQIQVNCNEGNKGDVRIYLSNAAQAYSAHGSNLQIGNPNPFGVDTSVRFSSGTCTNPQTMACLYCGFDGQKIGVDNETWYQWKSVEVIIPHILSFLGPRICRR